MEIVAIIPARGGSKDLSKIVGRKAKRDIPADTLIMWGDLDG